MGKFIKNKKIYIALGLKIFIIHECIPVQKVSIELKILHHLFVVDFQ